MSADMTTLITSQVTRTGSVRLNARRYQPTSTSVHLVIMHSTRHSVTKEQRSKDQPPNTMNTTTIKVAVVPSCLTRSSLQSLT
jgi:hypothetical protein